MPATTRRCAPSKYRMSHAVTRWVGCRNFQELPLCGRRHDAHDGQKISRSRTDRELKKASWPWKPVVAKEYQCTRKCTEPGRNLIDEWQTVGWN
jgi:hypothetical protein